MIGVLDPGVYRKDGENQVRWHDHQTSLLLGTAAVGRGSSRVHCCSVGTKVNVKTLPALAAEASTLTRAARQASTFFMPRRSGVRYPLIYV